MVCEKEPAEPDQQLKRESTEESDDDLGPFRAAQPTKPLLSTTNKLKRKAKNEAQKYVENTSPKIAF